MSGKLTVDRAILSLPISSMNNQDEWPGWNNSGIRNIIDARSANYLIPADKFICNIASNKRMYCYTTNSSDLLYFEKGTWYNLTQTEWKTNYPDLTIQFAILLDTPLTYQLTPAEVTTLLGQNRIRVMWMSATSLKPERMSVKQSTTSANQRNMTMTRPVK